MALALGVAQTPVSAETLRLATEPSYAPFEFMDSKTKQFVGFDIDLAKALAKKMNVELTILQMGFDAIIPAVLSNNVDFGMSAFTITPARKKHVSFVGPYYTSGLTIVVRRSDAKDVKGFKDLKNKLICAQIGTSGSLRAAKVPGATVKNFNSVSDTFMELDNGGCYAVVGDRPVNAYFMATRKNAEELFSHVDAAEESEEFGIVVAKGNKTLFNRIDKAFKELKASGEFKTIYDKWFK